ncbi:DNA repair protein [Planctomicrobium sp. SH668]|uniref:DNA repair protein n=1 Tax=Planctomicrobium sp. SH668 TaxID=3448126 RepID=UPI003F5CBC51
MASEPQFQTMTSEPLPSPRELRSRAERLLGKRDDRVKESQKLAEKFQSLNAYLAIAEKVSDALQQLSEQLFQELLNVVQEKLTIALQEILDQPIEFVANADFKRGGATVEFSIKKNGNKEDILRGQGGSVANILSVGLRLFALTTLDETKHRRFLVLDEQDCWIRPDLVPKLVKIVQEAGRALGFQVIMVSHHDIALFERSADKIYEFSVNSNGSVNVEERKIDPALRDSNP